MLRLDFKVLLVVALALHSAHGTSFEILYNLYNFVHPTMHFPEKKN